MGSSGIGHIAAGLFAAFAITATPTVSAGWTSWTGASEVYPSGINVNGVTKSPDDIVGQGGVGYPVGNFIWYCANALDCPSSAATSVHFHYTFDTASFVPKGVEYDIHNFDGYIQADDYFAMYVNGVLVSGLTTRNGDTYDGWLDHGTVRADGTFEPIYFSQLGGLLNKGVNDIDIFACDGYPPPSVIEPGSSADQAFVACPNATPRGNRYLLFGADVTLNTLRDPDLITVEHNHIVSDGSWTVRAVSEPETVPLALVALFGLFVSGSIRARRDPESVASRR